MGSFVSIGRARLAILIAGAMLAPGAPAARAAAFDPTDPNNAGINYYNYPVDLDASGNNPGVSTIGTTSATQEITYVDTPSIATQNDYQITLQGVLNGTQSIFEQTFAVPFSDPTVQSAVSQADTALTLAGANSLLGPSLIANSTSLASSQLSYTQTGSSTSLNGITSTEEFGPVTLYNIETLVPSGNNFFPAYDVVPGQLGVNVNYDYQTTIDRDAITTNTYLTSQTYVIDGFTSAVPEAATGGLLGVAGLATLSRRRRYRKLPATI